jgi:ribosomal protein L32E
MEAVRERELGDLFFKALTQKWRSQKKGQRSSERPAMHGKESLSETGFFRKRRLR